ncbi:hypothetical protein FPQ18DRAFT_315894 [Pyronema domesticum]|nr:hypothetical protein FPQ18DRAFT_315894 [Pyronema domesticum]
MCCSLVLGVDSQSNLQSNVIYLVSGLVFFSSAIFALQKWVLGVNAYGALFLFSSIFLLFQMGLGEILLSWFEVREMIDGTKGKMN